jgi:hypothetical protein
MPARVPEWRGREAVILKPATVIGGAIEVLNGGDAHCRELALEFGKFVTAHDGLLNVRAFRHKRKHSILRRLFAYGLKSDGSR